MNFLTLYLLPLIVGWVLDLVFGDPEKLPHPVVLFGKLIAKGERLLSRGSWRRMKGALLAIGLVAATVAATWAMLQLADAIYIIIGVGQTSDRQQTNTPNANVGIYLGITSVQPHLFLRNNFYHRELVYRRLRSNTFMVL